MLPGSLAECHDAHQRPGRDCTGAIPGARGQTKGPGANGLRSGPRGTTVCCYAASTRVPSSLLHFSKERLALALLLDNAHAHPPGAKPCLRPRLNGFAAPVGWSALLGGSAAPLLRVARFSSRRETCVPPPAPGVSLPGQPYLPAARNGVSPCAVSGRMFSVNTSISQP